MGQDPMTDAEREQRTSEIRKLCESGHFRSFDANFSVSFLLAERDRLQQERDEAVSARKSTQLWYAGRYGKLQDWARKILPEPWVDQFFSCIANGLYDWKSDLGTPYMSVGAGMVQPSGYFKMDTAQEQILHDQTIRAERAEAELAKERERIKTLTEGSSEKREWF